MYYIFISFILLVVTAFLYLYWFFKQSHKFFDKYGIPYSKPHWFYGNITDTVLMKKPIWQVYREIYEKHPWERFAGLYSFYKPSVMIRDPELIKNILIKDFQLFNDRGMPKTEDEPLLTNLFNMEGQEWKTLRIKLSGTFTSGKMKIMFPLLKKCAEDIAPVLNEFYKTDQEFEAKELCSRFTTDVIGSCVFGIETHCLKNPDSVFQKMGTRILQPRWQVILRIIFPNMPKFLVKFFKLKILEKEIGDYFTNIVKDVIEYREKNNIIRGDFLDILMALKNNQDLENLTDPQDSTKFKAQKGKTKRNAGEELTIEQIVAQCFLFFIGGFESTSSAVRFFLFAMAEHLEIQNKLRQEILSALEKNGGELTYELMKSIPYLEMVIDETFRRYPTGGFLNRVPAANYKIPDSNTIIKKGTQIVISVLGLHGDKKYFEKPDQFYPEHFTSEAKLNRHNYAFIPFGEGPRVCIAERFARMQLFAAAIYLLKDFSFELSPKTKVPFEYSAAGAIDVKGGVWLKCRPYYKEPIKT